MKVTVQKIPSFLLRFNKPSLLVPKISSPFFLHSQIFRDNTRYFHAGCVSKLDLRSGNREEELLVSQRKQRPISPHLTIYEPEMSWYLSSLHRISGVLLALGFYAFTITLGVTTLLGMQTSFQDLNKWYHEKLPKWSQWLLKGSAGYLFAFHFGNGIRHLVWDMGYELTNPAVVKTGSVVLAGTLVLGTYLLAQ
ncbi:protein SHH3 [Saccharomyces eubayanus]|uniref:protein SHH3 n=1 Tax=Saccharomyces eubayanus TaxID=1080349 RepID=UPI0006C3A19B|nr:SHH3-like protein [Saccharomyces eubayanus]KOG97455.1 SHH3-like protein [Saccharomyces eubayanus]